MKFVCLFLISIFFAEFAHGQADSNIQRLISLTENTYFPEVRAELDSFSALFDGERTEGKLKFYNNHRPFRSFGMGIEAYTLNFEQVLEIKGSTFKSVEFKLTILFDEQDSTIFYTKLVNYSGYGNRDYEIPVTLQYDSIQFEKYFLLHDDLYSTLTERNYASPPFLSKRYFGPLCMNHSAPQRDEMLKAVKNKRKDILLTWLKSFNIENKTYGATGLYLYKKDGGVLSEDEESLLITTQRLKAEVQTDLGIKYMFLFLDERRLEREFEDYLDEFSQEEKLIYALRNLDATSPFEDSSLHASRLNQFVFELTETLQNEDITTFYQFKHLTDSLGFHFQMNQSESSEYALYTFRHWNDYWNYVLKNRKIIYKEEQVFHHFDEIHELKPNEFLLVKLMNEMSYSCYEAFVFNDLNRTKGTKCLTVCSWTNVDESYIAGRDSLTGEPVIIGRMESYDPIPILFNSETKSISYSFLRLSDEKKITRKAKYKRGKFNIESYDAQTEEYPE